MILAGRFNPVPRLTIATHSQFQADKLDTYGENCPMGQTTVQRTSIERKENNKVVIRQKSARSGVTYPGTWLETNGNDNKNRVM